MKSKEWFAVDREGLAKILRRRGIEFAVFELIQNAWDEDGVTEVHVTLLPNEGKRSASLVIVDDAPEGFKDLTHSFTLFADSAKKAQAEKRGRFNLGEKLVLALCDWAQITSTKGGVIFDKDGRHHKTKRREHGTEIILDLKMTRDEIEQVGIEIRSLIPPTQIVTTYNGQALTAPSEVMTFDATLPTEIADGEGALRKSTRKTMVSAYRVAEGDTARIYEMGIPVVEHDCAFHCDVQQKIPLTLDRENVSTAFLKALRVATFNATHEIVTPEQVTHEWAQTAIESPDAYPQAVEEYMTKRFGKLRTSYDMSDPEANSKAVSNGYVVVHGGMLSGAAWQNVKRFETIVPSGKLFPTHPEGGLPFEPAKVTDRMNDVAEYAEQLARVLLKCEIAVKFGKQPTREAASWGERSLQFNVTNLGERWFDLDSNRVRIDDLIIHEFGHHYESNHLSERYYDALTDLGARFVAAVRRGELK